MQSSKKIYQILICLQEESPKNSNSWARHIRNLAKIYDIEDPIRLLKKYPYLKQYLQSVCNITVLNISYLLLLTIVKCNFSTISSKGLKATLIHFYLEYLQPKTSKKHNHIISTCVSYTNIRNRIKS